MCSSRYVNLVEMDQQHVKTTWASAFCIAQYPDPYVMWALSDEVQGDNTLQEFHLPEAPAEQRAA